MSQQYKPRSEGYSLKCKLYWKYRKFHRTRESINFLEQCYAENISPKFVRLGTTFIQKNKMPFSEVKRIEMTNVRRELLFQKNKFTLQEDECKRMVSTLSKINPNLSVHQIIARIKN